ncbi:MAG: hypothetical protein K8R99_14665 [Actinomycetia bacterium]|nr:hypothetical protein [Actinomycetes bacterium]
MRYYKLIAGLLVVTGAASVPGGVASVSGASQSRQLVESASCHRPPPRAQAAVTPANAQTSIVTVPATVFLRVDRAGRVTAAATNTGCAPRHGDDVYLFRPDGSITVTTTVDVEDVDWVGDFTTPGVFQPQR